MAGSTQRPGDLIQGINVTPLVDVVLVLLIAVMVTASYTVSQALPMTLPQARTGETSSDPMAISIDAEGNLFLDAAPVSKSELRLAVRQRHSRQEASALLAADAAARHRMVVGVIDLLRSEGIEKFAINVAPEELDGSTE